MKTFILITWLLFWATHAIQAAERVKLIVAYDEHLDYSKAVWNTVEDQQRTSPLPFEIVPVQYRQGDYTNVAVALKNAIGPVLVLGPANSEDATAMDVLCKARSAPTLFVSPSVSTMSIYSNFTLVGACLSDKVRLDSLAQTAPQAWANLPAAFIGLRGKWSSELYQHLGDATNLVQSLKQYQVSSTSSEYREAIMKCKAQRFPIVFLALEDSTEVQSFLREFDTQNTWLSPYSPVICLLGDYRFTNAPIARAAESHSISTEWARRYCLAMTSEVSLGKEDSDVYGGLTKDLLNILRHLQNRNASDPVGLFTDIQRTFTTRNESKILINGVTLNTSHYYRYLSGAEFYPAELKWLRSAGISFGKPGTWDKVENKKVPAAFWFALLSSRVAWIASPLLIALFFAALCAGWYIEGHKRYIYVRREVFSSIIPRIFIWMSVLLFCFIASVYLCWTGVVNSSNFVGVFLLCLSPMAILSMVDTAALSKVPVVKPLATVCDSVLERIVNSKAKGQCSSEKAQVIEDLKSVSNETKESQLWLWLYDELRQIKDEKRARRLFERGNQLTRPWDADLEASKRQEALTELLAYARVVAHY